MNYDNELTLIKEKVVPDNMGIQNTVETKRNVLCCLKSITSKEFYNGAISNIKPEIAFIIKNFEYEDEKKVIFEGTTYSVIRTQTISHEEIKIICERKIGSDKSR